MACLAKVNVDKTEEVRMMIGIAKYNEYVKELEDKFGKEKAAEIIAEPVTQLKKLEATRLLYRLEKNQHPRGAPKTKEELATWTQTDQSRLDMGEKAYWDAVRVFGSEFGFQTTDRLFHVQKDADAIAAAVATVMPGTDTKEIAKKTMNKFNELMEPVREKAPENATVDELATAFKKVYPNKAAFDSKLA